MIITSYSTNFKMIQILFVSFWYNNRDDLNFICEEILNHSKCGNDLIHLITSDLSAKNLHSSFPTDWIISDVFPLFQNFYSLTTNQFCSKNFVAQHWMLSLFQNLKSKKWFTSSNIQLSHSTLNRLSEIMLVEGISE